MISLENPLIATLVDIKSSIIFPITSSILKSNIFTATPLSTNTLHISSKYRFHMYKLISIWFLEQNFHSFFKLCYTFFLSSNIPDYLLLVYFLISFLYDHFMGYCKVVSNISFQFYNLSVLIDKMPRDESHHVAFYHIICEEIISIVQKQSIKHIVFLIFIIS